MTLTLRSVNFILVVHFYSSYIYSYWSVSSIIYCSRLSMPVEKGFEAAKAFLGFTFVGNQFMGAPYGVI